MKKKKEKINKNTVPEGFTVPLALADAVPVVFFALNAVMLGMLFQSGMLLIGALLCFLGGAGKVLWKIIAAVKKKNVWFLFVQMRVLMPLGFLMMIAAVIFLFFIPNIKSVLAMFITMPSVIFFGIGILGMVLMGVFAAKLDSSDVRSNRIEQGTNGISQIAIFIGILLLIIR